MIALVVAEKNADELAAVVKTAGMSPTLSDNLTDAAALAESRDFDCIILYSPYSEQAADFVDFVASTGFSAFIWLTQRPSEGVKRRLQEKGVFVLEPPIRQDMLSAILAASAAGAGRIRREKEKMASRLSELRMVSQAKAVLMSALNMSENEAHHYIEREAMNRRITKKEVSESILRTYQN